MRNSKFSNLYTIIIVVSIFLLSFSTSFYSQSYKLQKNFDMQSVNKIDDELSDLEDTSKMLSYVSVIVVVGVCIYLITNNDSGETDSENTNETKDDDNSADFDDDDYGFSSLLLKKEIKEEIPINVYLGMKRNNNQFSDNTFQIGVSYNF